MNWKTNNPINPGVYVASTSRAAGFVRHWDGAAWSKPTAIYDVHLNARTLPDGITPRCDEDEDAIEWLEQYTRAAESFTAWSGMATSCPVPLDMAVLARFKNMPQMIVRAGDLNWRHAGSQSDVVAYKVVDPALHSTSSASSMPALQRSADALLASPAPYSLKAIAGSFPSCDATRAIHELGEYQEGGDGRRLLEALRLLGVLPRVPQKLLQAA